MLLTAILGLLFWFFLPSFTPSKLNAVAPFKADANDSLLIIEHGEEASIKFDPPLLVPKDSTNRKPESWPPSWPPVMKKTKNHYTSEAGSIDECHVQLVKLLNGFFENSTFANGISHSNVTDLLLPFDNVDSAHMVGHVQIRNRTVLLDPQKTDWSYYFEAMRTNQMLIFMNSVLKRFPLLDFEYAVVRIYIASWFYYRTSMIAHQCGSMDKRPDLHDFPKKSRGKSGAGFH